MDVVVTVPMSMEGYGPDGVKLFGLDAWANEGCLPGETDPDELEEYYGFTTFGPIPDNVKRGDRVYVVCENFVRGYAPLVELYSGGRSILDGTRRIGFGPRRLEFIRRGGAEAVTIRGHDGLPEPAKGFRGWRYRWWDRDQEMPFPEWRTYGRVKRSVRKKADNRPGLFGEGS